MIKMDKIKDKIAKIKQKVNEYFFMKNSIGTLSNVIRKFYVLSVEFDEIFYGIKNPKRMKLCKILCIILWLTTLWHFLLLLSPSLWSLIDNPFLPDYKKTCIFTLSVTIFFIAILKTDYLFGEINGHLDTFKVFHIITYNTKFLHKLNEKNYKRLAILSRIIIIIMINYVTTFFSILVPLAILIIAILSKQSYVYIHFI